MKKRKNVQGNQSRKLSELSKTQHENSKKLENIKGAGTVSKAVHAAGRFSAMEVFPGIE